MRLVRRIVFVICGFAHFFCFSIFFPAIASETTHIWSTLCVFFSFFQLCCFGCNLVAPVKQLCFIGLYYCYFLEHFFSIIQFFNSSRKAIIDVSVSLLVVFFVAFRLSKWNVQRTKKYICDELSFSLHLVCVQWALFAWYCNVMYCVYLAVSCM